MQADDDELCSVVRQRYLQTPASHLPGSGPYALDSYRIFCGAADEWKEVAPNDKELVKFLVRRLLRAHPCSTHAAISEVEMGNLRASPMGAALWGW